MTNETLPEQRPSAPETPPIPTPQYVRVCRPEFDDCVKFGLEDVQKLRRKLADLAAYRKGRGPYEETFADILATTSDMENSFLTLRDAQEEPTTTGPHGGVDLGDFNFDGLAEEGRKHICRILVEVRRIEKEICTWLNDNAEGKSIDGDAMQRVFELQSGFLGESLENIQQACNGAIDDLLCIEDCNGRLATELREGATNG